jgi:LmbE family N-acetylglucosaminyl deacetylase
MTYGMIHQYMIRKERVERAEELVRRYDRVKPNLVFTFDALCSRYDIDASRELARKVLAEARQAFEWLVGPPR